MPKTARRNTIVLLVALCVPLLIFASLRGHATSVSYVSRCGPDYRLFLLCCCAAAALACFAAAAGLAYSAHRRARGHPLNGITYTWAGFAAAVGVLALTPFFNLRSAPCWITPALYSLVALAASAAALHTTRRMPELLRVPTFEIDRLIAAGEVQLGKMKTAPDMITAEENARFAPVLEELLAAMRAEVEAMRSDREGAQ